MIKPTVGRVVWYWPHGADPEAQPLAAFIAYVHNDTCINIGFLRNSGIHDACTSVQLWQGEGEQPSTPHCQWMPYQQGQAARAEQLEKKLSETGNVGPT